MTRNNKIGIPYNIRKTQNVWFRTLSSRSLSLKFISLESARS
jgi:hypothetical protein